MPAKLCAFFAGGVYLFFGICGFIPSLVHLPPDRLRFYDMNMIGPWGFLFSWLPVNPVHNVIYIVLGGLGVLLSPIFATATFFCRALFGITILFTILGLLPLGIAQIWGVLPLFGWNVMLHTVTAVLCYYYGFIYPLDLGGQEIAPA